MTPTVTESVAARIAFEASPRRFTMHYPPRELAKSADQLQFLASEARRELASGLDNLKVESDEERWAFTLGRMDAFIERVWEQARTIQMRANHFARSHDECVTLTGLMLAVRDVLAPGFAEPERITYEIEMNGPPWGPL